jgi:hypothetical protein
MTNVAEWLLHWLSAYRCSMHAMAMPCVFWAPVAPHAAERMGWGTEKKDLKQQHYNVLTIQNCWSHGSPSTPEFTHESIHWHSVSMRHYSTGLHFPGCIMTESEIVHSLLNLLNLLYEKLRVLSYEIKVYFVLLFKIMGKEHQKGSKRTTQITQK